jgi:phosphoglycerate dehydrogenase-like enzyme
MRVAYTDPAWALNGARTVDARLAVVEREVFGDDIDFDLGVCMDGRFVTDGPQLWEYVEGADALVVYRCQVTPELLGAAGERCKVVARQGVGIDNLNAELLRDFQIFGFNVSDYCGDEVSTHALALALALERGVCIQDSLVKRDRWSIHGGGVPRRTNGLAVGIIGYGRIGRASSRKFQAVYGSIAAYDPYVSADLMAGYGVRRCAELSELMRCSDVILVHAALTPETDLLIDDDALANVKPGALLVNTARGRLVDPQAVLSALHDGRLCGFASDVFSPEDPNVDEHSQKLLQRDNVVVSAHRAFLSTESERSLRRRVAAGVAHVLRHGAPPPEGRLA